MMDVAVKGIFWLLEACRISPTFQQFLLIGGDNSLGHFVYPHPIPVTETQRHTSYAGCYALSKVLDEVIRGLRHGSGRWLPSSRVPWGSSRGVSPKFPEADFPIPISAITQIAFQ